MQYILTFSDNTVSFIIPRSFGGTYIIGLGQTVSSLNWDSASTEVLCEVDQGKKTRFNDAKCDASGRLWAGIYFNYSCDYTHAVVKYKLEHKLLLMHEQAEYFQWFLLYNILLSVFLWIFTCEYEFEFLVIVTFSDSIIFSWFW